MLLWSSLNGIVHAGVQAYKQVLTCSKAKEARDARGHFVNASIDAVASTAKGRLYRAKYFAGPRPCGAVQWP